MREFFAMDGPFYIFFNKVGGMIAVSFFWLLGCVPVLTIGTSTAAAYYAMVKVVRKETGRIPQEFWRAYKKNLKNGIISTVIILLVIAFMIFDSILFKEGYLDENSIFTTIWGAASKILIFFVAFISLYLFPVMSRFEMKLKNLWTLSFVMAVRFFYFTIIIAVLLAAILFVHLGGVLLGSIEWVYRTIPLIFVTPGLYFFVSSFMIERAMRKYMPDPDPDTDPEDLKWYYK